MIGVTRNRTGGWYGYALRKYVALGFTGRMALAEYLGRNGVIVRERVVRGWHDKCRLYTPEHLAGMLDLESGELAQRPLVTEADLRKHILRIRQWYHRDGFSVHQVVLALRALFSDGYAAGCGLDVCCCSDKDCGLVVFAEDHGYHGCRDVTYGVVSDFLRRNPKYAIAHWQHLLQDPFVGYLQELKDGHYIVPDEIHEHMHPEARSGYYSWAAWHKVHQSFFKAKLWAEFCVSCEMRVMDLHNVWPFICKPDEPYVAVLPCCECGYVFPHVQVIIDHRRRLHMGQLDICPEFRDNGGSLDTTGQVSALSFVCEHCVADAGLCQRACMESMRRKWRQTHCDDAYWHRRFAPRGELISNQRRGAALERSLIALYERREVAKQADCRNLNRFSQEIHRSYQSHDEVLYKYGFDVPLPQFLQNAKRAAWLRIPESELPEGHRISDGDWTIVMQDRIRRAACRERRRDYEARASQPV